MQVCHFISFFPIQTELVQEVASQASTVENVESILSLKSEGTASLAPLLAGCSRVLATWMDCMDYREKRPDVYMFQDTFLLLTVFPSTMSNTSDSLPSADLCTFFSF